MVHVVTEIWSLIWSQPGKGKKGKGGKGKGKKKGKGRGKGASAKLRDGKKIREWKQMIRNLVCLT